MNIAEYCEIDGDEVILFDMNGQIVRTIFPPSKPKQATINGGHCIVLLENSGVGAKGVIYDLFSGSIVRQMF